MAESTSSPRGPSDYLKLTGASALCGDLSPKTIRRAIASGALRAFRPTGSQRGLILLKRSDVIRWIESSAINPVRLKR